MSSSSRTNARAITVARTSIRSMRWLNGIAGALILALFIATLIDRGRTLTSLGVSRGGVVDWKLQLSASAIMLVGIAASIVVNALMVRLDHIATTALHSRPFVIENAERLRFIAWAVLGLEILHATGAGAAAVLSHASVPVDIHWSANPTRWMVIVLLFALAHVFEHGTRMQDDLEGLV